MGISDENKFERKCKTDWTPSLVHEYTGLLWENSLELLQKSDKNDQENVKFIIVECLENIRDNLEFVLGEDIKLDKFELNEVGEINFCKIDSETSFEIANLCEKIRCKIRDLFSEMNYHEKMMNVASFPTTVLQKIREMEIKVNNRKTEIE